ncbi:MAG: AAA family ATPase [Candidatus Peregrinibacteria bacterium]
MNPEINLYEEARRYASLGWSVIPMKFEKYEEDGVIKYKKKPAIEWKPYQERLPTDEEHRRWFSRLDVTGIGLVTGKLSGVVVLDAEKDGLDDLRALKLPETVTSRSGGGGIHSFFKYPDDGLEVPSPTRMHGRKMDARADGGIAILPPSLHPSRNRYQWERDIFTHKKADCPLDLLAMIRERGKKAESPVTEIKEGSRNSTLASLAGSMKHRGLGQSVIEKALIAVNQTECKPPLPEDEVKGIAASIAKYKEQAASRSPVIICLNDVKPEKISWVWEHRIPLGKLTIVEGDPGVGKSTIALDIAAHVSRGDPLPGDEHRTDIKPMKCLLLTPEDGLADTIRPRLDKMEADVTKVLSLEAVKDSKGNEQHFSLQKDLALMDEHLEGGGYGLVVIDPLNAYMASVDTYKDAEVRTVLTPLAKMAEKHNVAVICVRHLTKEIGGKAIYRGQGSIGFAGAARMIHLVGRTALNPELCAMICTKSNICKLPPPMGFSIEDSSVTWKGEIDATAADLLSPPQPEEKSALEEATDFLESELSAGSVPSNDVLKAAKAQGISQKTLRRAKKSLEIEACRVGTTWEWKMAKKPTPTGRPSSLFGLLEEIEEKNMAIRTEGESLGTLEDEPDMYEVAGIDERTLESEEFSITY